MPRLPTFTESEERFLIARLRREWEQAERAMKRHEHVEQAKSAGKFVAKSLFALALLGGVVLVAAAAPNTFAAHGKMFGGRRFYERNEFKKQFRYLQAKKYVQSRKTEYGYHLTLTVRGRAKALQDVALGIRIPPQQKWDGTWWMVMFDIPRRKNSERNILRERLKQIGMEPFQESVFISRYPCRDEVLFAARLLNIEHCITIAHVDSLEGYRNDMQRRRRAWR